MNSIYGRRGFMGRLSALSVGVGSFLTGIVPELRAQALSSNQGLPVPIPMEVGDLNSWYSSALNSPSVQALMRTLPEQTRLDPPSYGSASVHNGILVKSVSFPLRSYTSGNALAFLVFGSVGSSATMPMNVLVGRDGKIAAASGNATYSVPLTAPGAKGLFAGFFPKEFLGSKNANLAAGQRAPAGGTNQLGSSSSGPPPTTTPCVDYPDIDGPVPDREFNCISTFKTCMDNAATFQNTAIGLEAAAVLCYVGCGATIVIPVLGELTCGTCVSMCLSAAIAEGIYIARVQACQDRLGECMAQYCGKGIELQPIPGYPGNFV